MEPRNKILKPGTDSRLFSQLDNFPIRIDDTPCSLIYEDLRRIFGDYRPSTADAAGDIQEYEGMKYRTFKKVKLERGMDIKNIFDSFDWKLYYRLTETYMIKYFRAKYPNFGFFSFNEVFIADTTNMSKFNGRKHTIFFVSTPNMPHRILVRYNKNDKKFYIYDPIGDRKSDWPKNWPENYNVWLRKSYDRVVEILNKLLHEPGIDKFQYPLDDRVGIQVFEIRESEKIMKRVKNFLCGSTSAPGYCYFFSALMIELICENPDLSLGTIEDNLIEMHKQQLIDITVMIREYFMYVLLMTYKIAYFAVSVGAGHLYPIDFYSTFVVKCIFWPDRCKNAVVNVYYRDPLKWAIDNGIENVKLQRVGVIQHVFVISVPGTEKLYIVPVRKLSALVNMISDQNRNGELDSKKYIRYTFHESTFANYLERAEGGEVLYF